MAVRKILLCKILSKTSPTAPRKFSSSFFFIFNVLSFGRNKLFHSWRRFPHVKVFFGVDRYASPVVWTYRPWRSRHSRRRFPHVRKKNTPKKNRGAIFFWRRPLRVTARLDESTVIFFVIIFRNFCP